MANNTKVRSAAELYEFSNHLRWAANDLNECYQKVKEHAADYSQQWTDESSAAFMQLLEREEHIIKEIEQEFSKFENMVRKRADMVQEYVSRGKMYRL